MRYSLIFIMVFLITGCGTSHEKLTSYVDQDIQQVVSDFGNPNVAFDMGNGRRDFQWTIKQLSARPSQAISRGALTSPIDMFDPDIGMDTITPMYAGQPVAAECYYTMITQWDDSRKTWIVKNYKKPRTGC